MESLKELIETRNQHVTDAREILARAEREARQLGADEEAKADELLTLAGDLDAQIAQSRKDDARRNRLSELEERANDPPRRQIPPGAPAPGRRPTSGVGADGATLTIDFGPRRPPLVLSPGDPAYERALPAYSTAFQNYLRGERGDYEALGLITGDDTKGGYVVPMAFLAQLIKFLDDAVTMRQLGTVLPMTTAKSVGVLSFDTDYADADWTAEVPASDLTEDDAARFGAREMTPWLLTKLIKASEKMMRSMSRLNLEAFIAARAAYKFSLSENKAFLTGTGSHQPLGVFTASADGITTARDVTASSATTFNIDDLINLKYSLKATYQARSTWLVHRDFMKILRKLKTGDGVYFMGIAGEPDTLLSRPIMLDENAPNTFTASQYVAILGDFSNYWIQDGIDLTTQRFSELFSLRNQVGWKFQKETDAMPVMAEAFARLKLAA